MLVAIKNAGEFRISHKKVIYGFEPNFVE